MKSSHWIVVGVVLVALLVVVVVAVVALFLLLPSTDQENRATVVESVNAVHAHPRPRDDWQPAVTGMDIYGGGQVRTGEESSAQLELLEGTVRLWADSLFTVKECTARRGRLMTTLFLLEGRLWAHVTTDEPHEFTVETGSAIAAVRDTHFSVGVTDGVTLLSVAEGEVELTAQDETVTVGAGEQARVEPGRPPSPPQPMSDEERSLWITAGEMPEPPTPTPVPTATGTPVPTETPVLIRVPTPSFITPGGTLYVFNSSGLEPLVPPVVAEIWEGGQEGMEASQGGVADDPKGIFGQVARLSVRGYGHGTQTAWVKVWLDVPAEADIVSVPVATSGNGHVDETDSDSGLEMAVYEPQSDRTVWTYASHMRETELDVPYIVAFADVSPFRGQRVALTLALRQLDVCAGSACTHDADLFIGDLYFARLPDICTTEADGSYKLYDYYDDPSPRRVTECENPQAYYFLDVEEGPHNAYGAGEDTYTLSFELPEGAEVLEFHLYYGPHTTGLTINDQTLSPEGVYAAFPVPSGAYLNIAEPSRHSPLNNNPQAVAPYFRVGTNTIAMTVYAENAWEERPFDLFARFGVPNP